VAATVAMAGVQGRNQYGAGSQTEPSVQPRVVLQVRKNPLGLAYVRFAATD